jgi:hypothetical protein
VSAIVLKKVTGNLRLATGGFHEQNNLPETLIDWQPDNV